MSHAYYHTTSSTDAKPGTGEFKKHLHLHQFLDHSKMILGNATHRSLLHHREGAELAARHMELDYNWSFEEAFAVAKKHIIEDMGHLPEAKKWSDGLQNREIYHGLPNALENTAGWLTSRGEDPEDCKNICAILLRAPILWTNAAGAYLTEAELGVIGSGKKPIRTLTERFIRTTFKIILPQDEYPSFGVIAENIPLQRWMYQEALPLSRPDKQRDKDTKQAEEAGQKG